jgi:hypothetical protein
MYRNLRTSALVANLALSLVATFLIIGNSVPYALAAGIAPGVNLYFHNDSSSPLVGGFVRTVSTMNTTQAWRSYPQGFVNFTGRLDRDFYLHPNLAGNFTINGTVWLHPWVVGESTGGSIAKASFTVALYDVSPSGQALVGSSASTGSLNIAFGNSAAQSEDVNSVPPNAPLKFSIGSYTFLPGHSILVHVEILPQGSGTTLSLYFDNQVTPSYVSLYSQTIVTVAKVWTTNSTGIPVAAFIPTGANLQVDMVANVTDPFGGYDINASTLGTTYARVTLNLTSPTGSQLLVKQRMTLISGSQLSFQNLFRLNYTLNSPFPGQYNYTVTAIDNSGNVAIGNGYFLVGQTYRLQAEAVDAKNRALAGALILGKIQGIFVFEQDTNSSGWIDRILVSGTYTLNVIWRGTIVDTTTYVVSQNSTVVLHSAVYDPKFQALDDVNSGLPQAEIFIQSPNGTRTSYPFFTNAIGYVNLTESQGGDYNLVVLWKGIAVFNNTINVTSDGPFAFKTQVYQIKIIAQGQDGGKLQGALIAIHSPTSAEIVYSFGLTDSTGTVIFRLPVGTYTVNGYYSTTYLLTAVNSPVVIQPITVTSSHTETLTFQGVPPPITSTLGFQLGALFLILLVLAAGGGYFIGKRGKGKSTLKAT